MSNKIISCIKRSADHIISVNDIVDTNDNVLYIARKIFVNHVKNEYKKQKLHLYTAKPFSHPEYPNITVTPHFIRDDGVIIYLNLVYNDIFLSEVSDYTIQISMNILKLKKTLVANIILNTKLDDIHDNLAKIYDNITYEMHDYSSDMAKQYINSSTRKKFKKISIKKSKSIITGFIAHDWVSASKTRNYILNDPLIDWLEYDGLKLSTKDNTSKKIIEEPKETNEIISSDFENFIKNKGIEFESHVIKLIKAKVQTNEFVTICSNMNNYDKKILEYEKQSIMEIKKGTPFIYQPVLMNRSGPLQYSYGMPDLLVRSDKLQDIIPSKHMPEYLVNYQAPNLKGAYHYVVVDIKFTTLELCSDGKRIRNSGCFPAYKSQLYIYNHALGLIQGYEPLTSYILGRRYKYTTVKQTYRSNNCFESVGHIEYNDWDNIYVKKSIEAIKWIKNLRINGKKWKLFPKPTVKELYPNMCNMLDTRWHDFKTSYANKIGEITLLWNCGFKNRIIAHKNKIFSINDDKCSADKLGINGPIQRPLLDCIININKETSFDSPYDRISMVINENNIDNALMLDSNMRITVDFETIGCVFDDFKQLPIASDLNYLFMIGVSYKIKDDPLKYKMFLLSELTANAEFQLIYQFHAFIKTIYDKYVLLGESKPPLCHYGHFEKSLFTSLCKKLKQIIGPDIYADIDMMQKDIIWFDLAKYLKQNYFVIHGCYKFGLKEIANRLNELGLIKTKWPKSTMVNVKPDKGNTAMIMAYNEYKRLAGTGIPINKSPIMLSIMEYNKVDCYVVHEIMDLIGKKMLNEKIYVDNLNDIMEDNIGAIDFMI